MPPNPRTIENELRSYKLRFACFLFEDAESSRPARNGFVSQFTRENQKCYVELVPLPPSPNESFEWLYNKVNWAVNYYLERHPKAPESEILFLASPAQVPIVAALYTVSMQRGTKFVYIDSDQAKKPSNLSRAKTLPSLLTWKGEPYRSSGLRKYEEAFYGSAAADFEQAWKLAGDKGLYALKLLSSCYDGLDRLSYGEALSNLNALLGDENCTSRLFAMTSIDFRQRLTKLQRFLRIAKKHFGARSGGNEMEVFSNVEAIGVFMRSLYTSALRRVDRHEYEQAVLLLYRVLEVVAQSLLAKNGLDSANFILTHVSKPRKKDFLEAIGITESRERSPTWDYDITRRLGALDSWTAYLFCCYDGDWGPVSNREAKLAFLGKMRSKVELRNKCFLEHGVVGVSERDTRDFAEWIRDYVAKPFMSIDLVPAVREEALKPLEIKTTEV